MKRRNSSWAVVGVAPDDGLTGGDAHHPIALMNPGNTLLGRCTVAYSETVEAINYPQHTNRVRRAGVAAVLEHLAAELQTLNQRNDRLSVHEVARMLRLEAAGELAGWDVDEA